MKRHEETERSVGRIIGSAQTNLFIFQSAGKLCIGQVGSRRSLLESGREACQTLAVDPHSDTGPCFGLLRYPLRPNEAKHITVALDLRAFCYYDISTPRPQWMRILSSDSRHPKW
jgi:hypothetical protein